MDSTAAANQKSQITEVKEDVPKILKEDGWPPLGAPSEPKKANPLAKPENVPLVSLQISAPGEQKSAPVKPKINPTSPIEPKSVPVDPKSPPAPQAEPKSVPVDPKSVPVDPESVPVDPESPPAPPAEPKSVTIEQKSAPAPSIDPQHVNYDSSDSGPAKNSELIDLLASGTLVSETPFVQRLPEDFGTTIVQVNEKSVRRSLRLSATAPQGSGIAISNKGIPVRRSLR